MRSGDAEIVIGPIKRLEVQPQQLLKHGIETPGVDPEQACAGTWRVLQRTEVLVLVRSKIRKPDLHSETGPFLAINKIGTREMLLVQPKNVKASSPSFQECSYRLELILFVVYKNTGVIAPALQRSTTTSAQ